MSNNFRRKSPMAGSRQTGVTLVEMIVTITLFTVMASLGALMISNLAPSYIVAPQAQQTLSAREAALWRLSDDFRQALLDGTEMRNVCELWLTRASGVGGTYNEAVSTHEVTYQWFTGLKQLWVSDPLTSSVLLNNVESCPFNYASGVDRARLRVNFVHKSTGTDPVATQVSTVYYTYVNGPYVASAVLGGAAISTVTLTGYFPGLDGGGIYSLALTTGATPVSTTVTTAATAQIVANVTPIASAVVDVKVTTPEGWSNLKQAFQFP